MRNPIDLTQLLVTFALLLIEAGCFAFFLTLTILSFKQLRHTWKTGLLLALIATLLGFPAVILGMYYMDLQHLSPGTDPALAPALKAFACIIALAVVAFTALLRILYYHVAAVEWARVWSAPQPTIINPAAPRRLGPLVGAAFGSLTAVASVLLVKALHVGESSQITQFLQSFPGLRDAPNWIALPSALGVGVAAAISEELIFRGGILAFLCRITHNKTPLAWLWIALTAALWAFLHFNNTDRPDLKLTQVFLLGLAFGWMARRWGLQASLAAHISLNIIAILAIQ